MTRYMTLVVLSTAFCAAQTQIPDQVRQATMGTSRGTSGKCTIEVRVDITAEVDIYGDSGRLRTLAGQPATWTRMECTSALPYSMSDFRFKGIDGRGNVRLVQDPRNNKGMAVIRIDDPKGGSEGYTFDIEWSGASGGAPTGGFATGGYYPSTTSPSATGGLYSGRRAIRSLTVERAMDLCRAEVHARGERDYGLRDIDITAAGVDTGFGRRNWISGTFVDYTANLRGAGAYRFSCEVDYNAAQVRSVQILRSDGSALQAGTAAGSYSPATAYTLSASDQSRNFRACQDAVVARAARDGYQNVSFGSTAVDSRRGPWVAGTITAARGPVTDTFDFGCSMDFNAAQVRNLELKRR